MAYWHKLADRGWTCADCGAQQYGEYHCEPCFEERMERANRDEQRRDIIDRGRAHPLHKSYVKLRRAMFVWHGL